MKLSIYHQNIDVLITMPIYYNVHISTRLSIALAKVESLHSSEQSSLGQDCRRLNDDRIGELLGSGGEWQQGRT